MTLSPEFANGDAVGGSLNTRRVNRQRLLEAVRRSGPISRAVGAGVVVGGKLHCGHHWYAGEISHMMGAVYSAVETAETRLAAWPGATPFPSRAVGRTATR